MSTPRIHHFVVTNRDIPDAAPPLLLSASPDSGETGIARDHTIALSLGDDYSGVSLATIAVYINGAQIFFNNTFNPGWSGTCLPNASRGYDFLATHIADWGWAQSITVRVVAADVAGNTLDTTWDFTVDADTAAPTVSASPLPYSTGAGVTDHILLSLSDDKSGVVLTNTAVYVDSVMIYNGAAFAAGWTSSTVVANGSNGYNFDLVHTAPWAPQQGLTVRVVSEDAVGNPLDTSWTFSVMAAPEVSKRGLIQIKVLALGVVRIYFPELVLASDAAELSHYALVPLDSNQNTEIIRTHGLETDEHLTDFVDLYLKNQGAENQYQITITGIHTAANELLELFPGRGLVGEFTIHKTKTDSLRGSTARLFDQRGKSTVFHLMVALALEDERIGGQGAPTSVVMVGAAGVSATYGTATFGSDTVG